MTDYIATIRELLNEATPLKWRVDVYRPEPKGMIIAHVNDDDTFEIVCKFQEADSTANRFMENQSENAKLIVELVNNASQLLDEIVSLRALLEERPPIRNVNTIGYVEWDAKVRAATHIEEKQE